MAFAKARQSRAQQCRDLMNVVKQNESGYARQQRERYDKGMGDRRRVR